MEYMGTIPEPGYHTTPLILDSENDMLSRYITKPKLHVTTSTADNESMGTSRITRTAPPKVPQGHVFRRFSSKSTQLETNCRGGVRKLSASRPWERVTTRGAATSVRARRHRATSRRSRSAADCSMGMCPANRKTREQETFGVLTINIRAAARQL